MNTTTMMSTLTEAERKFSKAYQDRFSYTASDEEAFLSAVKLLGSARTVWSVKLKDLVFRPMPDALEAAVLFDGDNFLQTMAYDSIESGTKVYLEIDGRPLMLRDTAMMSIYDRLRISGEALNAIPAETLAAHLNDYAKYTPGDGLLIFNNGKVEAILGRKYNLLPAEELMEKAADFFAAGRPAEFREGSYTHSYSQAVWHMGECKVESPFDAGSRDLTYEQAVCVSTSDNGRKAITVSPQMRLVGEEYGLSYCLPLKLEHNGNTNLTEYEKTLKLIDKRFQDSSDLIRELVETVLDYPTTVLLAMLKFLKIPAKYGAQVYENRKIMWGENVKTAYDVYSSLSDVLSLLMGEERNAKALAEYRERFSRALKFDFSSYDLPGQYSYNDKLIGRKGV